MRRRAISGSRRAVSFGRRAVSFGRRAVKSRSAYVARLVTERRCRILDGRRVIVGARR